MDSETCFFCKSAPADPARAVAVEAERGESASVKTVATAPVLVPRCAACARRHRIRQSLGAVTLTLVVLSWIFGLPLVLAGENGPVWYLVACVGVTVSNIVFWRWRDRSAAGKSVWAAADHPALDALRQKGFSLVVRR